ncbi:hypothetical protein LSCM4_08051 [Leishmania orientalis]|uniref:Uncharacterized protein n=1 Tax=Leishmania orientalis TaxID=2249476 RepID=A0A836H6A7_9TRYP|nr:hypothetical protein LSCM4_08051 [Leishmania orientalis]
MDSRATLPHAVALAQELETELRHLDDLQQRYAQLLVCQLSSLDFLDEGDATTMVAAAEPTTVPSGGYVAAKPDVAVVTAGIKRPSTLPLPWRHHASDAARVLQQPSAAISEPPPLPPPPKRRGRSAAMPGSPRPSAGTTCHALPPPQAYAAAAPAVPASRRDETARRARRALRLLREDRDAHFNAKSRRAEELLREGREAAQKSRARRLAENDTRPR